MTISPTFSVVISRSSAPCSSCSISSAMRSSTGSGTLRLSQARTMPLMSLLLSKVWRLPSRLMTTSGRLSMIS